MPSEDSYSCDVKDRAFVGVPPFDDLNITGDDYIYDANGNMTLDKNKNIGAITYNYLNLPDVVSVTGNGTIACLYSVTGQKLQKKTTEGARTVTTDYTMEFEYRNDSLTQLAHAEGRVRYAKDTGSMATVPGGLSTIISTKIFRLLSELE